MSLKINYAINAIYFQGDNTLK